MKILQVYKKQIRKHELELKLRKTGKAKVNVLTSKENMDSVLGGAEDLVTKLMEKAITCCLFCFGWLAIQFDLPALKTVPQIEEDQGIIYIWGTYITLRPLLCFGGLCQTQEVSDD